MGFLQKLLDAIFGNKKSKSRSKPTQSNTPKQEPKPEAKKPVPEPPKPPTPPTPPVAEEEIPVVAEEKSSDEQEAAEVESTPEPKEKTTPPVVEDTPEPKEESTPPTVGEEEIKVEVVAEEHPEAPISEQLIEGAKKYVGTPYLYGGTTPEGFDCSGFVGQVFEDMGMDLPRTSRQQAELGTRIDISEVQTGDLVFFSHSGGRIDHVGIVTSKKGEPMAMVHASTSKGVIFSDLEKSTYWKPRITHAQRVLG